MDVRPDGVLHILTPVGAGRTAATYESGECAAVVNAVGKGRTVLLGFHPGFTYRLNGAATGKGREWLTAPVLHVLGRPRVDLDYPSAEATLFEHEDGIVLSVRQTWKLDFGATDRLLSTSPAATGFAKMLRRSRGIAALQVWNHSRLEGC